MSIRIQLRSLSTRSATTVVSLAGVIGLSLMFLATPVGAQIVPASWIQLGSDVDGEAANDLSGEAVAISADGTTLAVGAELNDGNGQNSGHVRVFRWDVGSWSQLGADIDGEAERDKSGSAVAISGDGTTVVIGAPFNADNGVQSGHARVFRWDGSSWAQVGADIDGEAERDQFGSAVAISAAGDTVVIGARLNDDSGEDAGHARVYRLNGSVWAQLGLDIDGEAQFNTSGDSVAISAAGDVVAVGASRNREAAGGAGHVRVFGWDGNGWSQVGADIDGQSFLAQAGSALGMSADGETLIVGTPGHENNASFRGGARIYRWDGGTWAQLGSVIEGEKPFDFAGSAVAISGDGDTVVVGADDNSGNGNFSGHARIFGWNGSDWTQLGADIDGEEFNDFAGNAVSMSGNGSTVVVGAGHNDGNGANSGHARIYRNTQQPPVLFCNGLEVTVNLALGETPTSGDDVIRGTAGSDTINALGGRDTICALQGADAIDAGDGFDTVFGGAGDDMIVGGTGNDMLIGGPGRDVIAGGRGNDRIQGGDDADTLDGDGGYDIIRGGNGNDMLRGGTHGDALFGNLGRDDVSGDGGDDILRGGAWLDTMDGGNGTDGCTLTDPSGNVEVRTSCETGVFGQTSVVRNLESYPDEFDAPADELVGLVRIRVAVWGAETEDTYALRGPEKYLGFFGVNSNGRAVITGFVDPNTSYQLVRVQPGEAIQIALAEPLIGDEIFVGGGNLRRLVKVDGNQILSIEEN